MRGPSSYSAGARAASSFNSFGMQSSGEIYGYRPGPYIYNPPCNNHYETADIYQDTDPARYSRGEGKIGPWRELLCFFRLAKLIFHFLL